MNRKIVPILFMFFVLALASLACQFTNRAIGIDSGSAPAPQTGSQPTTQPLSGGSQEIRQWAVSATASTQYSESSWNAEQATGAPNVTECGDNGLAWAASNDNSVEWLELAYATPVIPTEIVIHQSYNPSQVIEVDVIDTDGNTYIAWKGIPKSVSSCPDEMTITLELEEKIIVNKIVITVDQSVLNLGWNEIDAVELVGTTPGS
jgi:hypothetical protein